MTIPTLFLKQFRGSRNGLDADMQMITESGCRITKFSGASLPGKFALDVKPLDSSPLIDELGLESQTLTVSYRIEMDFDAEVANIIWDAAPPPGGHR